MVDHTRSSLLSVLLVVAAVVSGKLFKELFAVSGTDRPSNFAVTIGGGIGSTVFIFTLTAISNIKMSHFGENATSGLAEVFGALVFGVIVAASIHRISATICVLFSLGSLVFLSGIAQQRYSPIGGSAQQNAAIKKRK